MPQSPDTREIPIVRITPEPQQIATMAVMRVDENGTIRLEEIASTELGSIEFAFGQTPLLPAAWTY